MVIFGYFQAILKFLIFWPKIVLKFSKNGRIEMVGTQTFQHAVSPHQNLTHHPGAAAQQVQNTHPGTHHRQQINQHVQQHPTPNHSNSPQAGGQVYGQPRFVNRGVRPYNDALE